MFFSLSVKDLYARGFFSTLLCRGADIKDFSQCLIERQRISNNIMTSFINDSSYEAIYFIELYTMENINMDCQ